MLEVFHPYIRTNRNQFIAQVEVLSRRLGILPEWMLGVMWIESRIRPEAVNPVSGATGLIQFMPATARSLGTTTEALRNMSNLQQLHFVDLYFRPHSGRMNSFFDVYFAVFFPIAIGRPDNWVLQAQGLSAELIARQNPAFDTTGSGQITVGEVKKVISGILERNLGWNPNAQKTAAGIGIGFAILAVGLLVHFLTKK